MVRIIKPGNTDTYNKVRTFECDRCGCVFEANGENYWVPRISNYDKLLVFAQCPCCRVNIHKLCDD